MLLVAVWVTSTLGLVHATLHVPGDRAWALSAERATAVAAGASEAHAPAQRHTWLHALFGDKTDAECRLYDRLSHGFSAPGVPLLVLPMVLPSATFAYLQGEAVARWIVLFDARGPPSTR
ncbi:hypothetical protein NWF24_22175 [Variovorax paradoxus]|jgi:hypothetical protein|uniref:hypothetical protein n=1 Tax=Variovorax paradoxus TaxID=34073 RepID=UPI0021ACBFD5|nr:hypothetical protein [Variovorax paradoxus]UVH55537.1 hypothetical protein NWF24_22175 [Variovorax paradoxus]